MRFQHSAVSYSIIHIMVEQLKYKLDLNENELFQLFLHLTNQHGLCPNNPSQHRYYKQSSKGTY